MNWSANPLVHLVRTAWAHAAGHRGRFVLYVVLSSTSLGIVLTEPYLIGRMLNAMQSIDDRDRLWSQLLFYLACYIGIQVGFWSLHGPSRVIERDLAYRIRTEYQMRLFNIVLALPVQWHKDHHSGSTIDKIQRACSGLFDFLERSFEVIHLCTRFVGSLVILLFFLPQAGGMVIAATGVAVTVVLLFDRVLMGFHRDLNRRFNHVATAVHDYVTNIITVLSLRLEQNVAREVLSRLTQTLGLFRRNAIVNEVKWFVTTMIVAGTIAGILLWYVARTLGAGQTLAVGTFFTLFEYLRRIGDSFYGFAWKYGTLVQFSANVRGAETITEAFDDELEVAAQSTLPPGWRRVHITGLNHAYEDEKHRSHRLVDLALTLERGRSIALVGPSGSGKSTLLALLRGLRAPQQAIVACDGEPLPRGLAHVAHHATLIPQDPEIFADTIRFNVTMGVAAEESSVLEAVRQAQFHTVLARLPSGLETNIAEKGVNLSGGEKQRLALARGVFFARQSDILLLDEPTSHVDSQNERVIYENLLSLARERCAISAIHRLHLLPLFDEVVVLVDGRIAERGRFADLVRAGGILAGLWRAQQADAESEPESATLSASPARANLAIETRRRT